MQILRADCLFWSIHNVTWVCYGEVSSKTPIYKSILFLIDRTITRLIWLSREEGNSGLRRTTETVDLRVSPASPQDFGSWEGEWKDPRLDHVE